MWLSLIIDKTQYSFIRAENWENLLWGGATSISDGIFLKRNNKNVEHAFGFEVEKSIKSGAYESLSDNGWEHGIDLGVLIWGGSPLDSKHPCSLSPHRQPLAGWISIYLEGESFQ